MSIDTERPVIKVPKKGIDFFFEWSALALVVFMWGFSLYHYPQLPATIPVHYGVSGYADAFGSKTTIFLLPGIVTAIFLLLHLLNRYPHKFNYLSTITPENAERQYGKSQRLLRYLQFFISLLFTYITVKEVTDAGNQYSKLDDWFLIVLFPGLMIPTIYTIYSSLSSSKAKK